MLQSHSVTKVTISDEMRKLLDQVKDSAYNPARFTPEIDAAILEYWPSKNKEGLAKALGFGAGQLRKRYKELTGDTPESD